VARTHEQPRSKAHERSQPSAVQFYERAGLLSPGRRADNGYRVLDESALGELAALPVPAGQPVTVAINDTLFKRRGKGVGGDLVP
jgi:hypothetical protein